MRIVYLYIEPIYDDIRIYWERKRRSRKKGRKKEEDEEGRKEEEICGK